jgi:hypothetical protein
MANQIDRVFQSFLESPKTMKEADVSSGIMRENITRYVRMLKRLDAIVMLRKRYCSITGHRAGEYTTNKELFPKAHQLSFDFD